MMCNGSQHTANKPTMMANDLAACTSICKVERDEVKDEIISPGMGACATLSRS